MRDRLGGRTTRSAAQAQDTVCRRGHPLPDPCNRPSAPVGPAREARAHSHYCRGSLRPRRHCAAHRPDEAPREPRRLSLVSGSRACVPAAVPYPAAGGNRRRRGTARRIAARMRPRAARRHWAAPSGPRRACGSPPDAGCGRSTCTGGWARCAALAPQPDRRARAFGANAAGGRVARCDGRLGVGWILQQRGVAGRGALTRI
mmetsp:Transcript_6776/g.21007  ORF Transcript_6776/g.21007 Transcript_6776/m.21007 type:complete len:202 (-) Transcript_6776:291-896(-)